MRARTSFVVWLVGSAALMIQGCGGPGPAQVEQPPATSDQPLIQFETVAGGLFAPWDMAFAPDGRIFVTERPGRIRVVTKDGLRPEPWAVVDVVPPDYRTEGGLLGIAVAPDFERTGHVYVVGTFLEGGRLFNRVLRFTERDGVGVNPLVVVDGLPEVKAEPGSEQAIHTHLGGGVRFGPDDMLYVTTGDATEPELSEDPSSLAGKILRYRPDGAIPPDNPTPGSAVYAMGLRNVQGLAWHPDTGLPFATDHGPSELTWETDYGGWFGDELNAIVPGADYGWPHVVGTGSHGPFVDPLLEWSPSIAPAHLTVYTGSYPPWRGSILVASLRGEHIRRVVIERDETAPAGWKAVEQERLLEGRVGRIRALAMGPDRQLYMTSSNRDGRGKPRDVDDRLYRVIVRGS